MPTQLLKDQVKKVYHPLRNSNFKKGVTTFPIEKISTYSLGRFAIKTALLSGNIGKGNTALLPSFICRDVLAPFNEVGAKIIFYDVDRMLEPILNEEIIKNVDVVLAVNYFGFPQNISTLKSYCEKFNITLIEDNAHGLFSKDTTNNWLGERGDCGIYSFRKTLPIFNGGGLIVNNANKFNSQNIKQQAYLTPKVFSPFNIKSHLRPIAYFFGGRLFQALTSIVRFLKKLKTGHEIMPSDDSSEKLIPGEQASIDIKNILTSVNVETEINRRRELFNSLIIELKNESIEPIWDFLPDGTAPYGLPFYCKQEEVQLIKSKLRSLGLECFPWPDLPSDIKHKVPNFYSDVWLVRFLW
jgi:hypothetical protein